MTEPLDLLAIGAHPDDVEMTSGGYLCLAGKQGYRTGVLHLTKGEMGTHGTPEERVEEARAAAEVMGCQSVDFAGLHDGYVEDDHESVRVVADFIRRLKPAVILAPNTKCHHPDHEAAGRICIKAVHFAGLNGYESKFEPHRIRRLVTSRYSRYFEPSFYVDISDVIEQKKQAILSYASQFRTAVLKDGKPVTRMSKDNFIDQYLSITASFGLKAGCDHAEAYRVETAPLLKDPIKILNEGPEQHLIR